MSDKAETIEHYNYLAGGDNAAMRAIRFSPDTQFAAFFHESAPVSLYSFHNGHEIDLLLPRPATDIAFQFDMTGEGLNSRSITQVAIATGDGDMVHRRYIVNYEKLQRVNRIQGASFWKPTRVSYSPDGKYLACGSASGTVGVFAVDGTDVKKILETSIGQGSISRLSFTNNNKMLLVINWQGLHVVEIDSGKIHRCFNEHKMFTGADIYAVASYPRPTAIPLVAIGGYSQLLWLVFLEDSDKFNPRAEYHYHCYETKVGGRVSDLFFLADGRLAVVGAAGAQILKIAPLGTDHVIHRDTTRDKVLGVAAHAQENSLLVAWSGKEPSCAV